MRVRVVLALFCAGFVLISGTFPAGADAARQSSRSQEAKKKKTVPGELARLQERGDITMQQRADLSSAYRSAVEFARRLSGRRKVEMTGVLSNMDEIAGSGQLTATRLPALWLILQRNREWWGTRELPASGTRVSFPGSELVFQYYVGEGFQLQPLANWGKVNALWQGGSRYNTRLGKLIDELLPLAAERGDTLAWEYYFDFGGGAPPWTSGMSQGVAVQALGRAGQRLGREEELLEFAYRALRTFEVAPPTGVRVPSETGTGVHYLLYSYDRDLRVLNAFAQTLVGLYDLAGITADARVAGLFAEGDAALKLEAPKFDTGAWSLYASTTSEASLNYHTLNRDFMKSLCTRTAEPVYCTLQQHFTLYLTTPPALGLITAKVRGGSERHVRFTLTKMSRVTMTILRKGRSVFTTTATVGRGKPKFKWKVPRTTGQYEVRLAATDLAGNNGSATGVLEVTKPPKKKREKRPSSGD